MKKTNSEIGDSIFMACGKQDELEKITALARDKIAKDLDLIDENVFAFCWIVDYPMFEKDESTNKIEFSHNPFSICLLYTSPSPRDQRGSRMPSSA